jgi:hypothetical protein
MLSVGPAVYRVIWMDIKVAKVASKLDTPMK